MRPKVLLAGIVALAAALVLALLVARRAPVDEAGSAPPATGEPAAHTAPESGLRSPGAGSSEVETSPARTADASAASESVRPTRGSPFTGRVVDARGAPIPDASVYLAAAERSTGIPLEHLAPERAEWAGRVETRTDAAGRFELASESTGRLRLVVRARGFAPRERVLATSDASHALGDIALAPSVVLAGRVVDSARKPVAGATLRRLTPDAKPEALFSSSGGDLAATTAADGTFEIDELASGPWLVLVHADARPDKLERGETTEPGQRVSGLEFVLADGAELRGRVVGAPPAELTGAWVAATPKARTTGGKLYAGEHADVERFVIVPRGARCAADGSFVVTGLSRDVSYRVTARASDDFFAAPLTTTVDANAGDTNVELPYVPGRALVFQVVDGWDLHPVTEFEVRFGSGFLMPLAGPGGRPQTSFPDGRVRIENVSAASGGMSLSIEIAARGYATLRLDGPFIPTVGDQDLGALRLEPAPVLTVRVVDAVSERPVAGADVVLVDESIPVQMRDAQRGNAAYLRGMTDAEGVVRLNTLPGKSARLDVRHADFAPFRGEQRTFSATESLAEEVRLHAGGTVVVEVRDELGAQVRGVRIAHTDDRGELEVPAANCPDGSRTNASGTLRFTHLAPGTHTFRVGGGSAEDATFARVLVADKSDETVKLVVPARGRLAGRVTEGGKPLSGATLSFVPRDADAPPRDLLSARTNGNGDYSVNSLALGVYRVSVAHPARVLAFDGEVHVADLQSRGDFDLPLAAITGRVVDETGRGLAGVCVRLERVRVETVDDAALLASAGVTDAPCAFSGADGHYTLRGVQTGVDLVAVVAGGNHQRVESAVLRLAANEVRAGIDLVARPGAVLHVHVTFAPGRTASVCRIRATEEGASSSVVIATGPGGAARFDGLRPGKWRVRVESFADGSVTTPLEQLVEIAVGATNKVTFELR